MIGKEKPLTTKSTKENSRPSFGCYYRPMRKVKIFITILAIVFCFAITGDACSLIHGYFHQVTHLKGRVVGKSFGPIQFRWLRRMYNVSGAELEVYEYASPRHKDAKPLARAVANSAGEFEFGTLKEGHYSLFIKGGGMQDSFDIEITNKVPRTKEVTLDISPIFSDCTGGHEFEAQAEKK
ncbi:MAG: hypothetical protein WA738_19455 [Candidatus Angelobacter sp.]